MSLKHGLLGIIKHEADNGVEISGYDIDKIFKTSICFFWKAQTSQIYREIQGLVEDGLLTENVIIQTDKPNKKVLSITEKGKDELIRWLLDKENVNKDSVIRNATLMKLFFNYNLSIDETIDYMQALKAKYENNLKELEISQTYVDSGKNSKTKPYYQICQNYGWHIEKAELDWVNESLENLYKIKNKE